MTFKSIIIRKAIVADAAALRELRLEALQNKPEAFGSDYEKESRDTLEDWKKRLTEQSDNVIFIAIVDSKFVGMTGIDIDSHTKMKHSGYIWGVYVQPAWRGQQISNRLIDACIEWAGERSLKFVKLGVATTNVPAINSYLRSGFRIYGVDPQVIYWDGIYYDEFMMVRDV